MNPWTSKLGCTGTFCLWLLCTMPFGLIGIPAGPTAVCGGVLALIVGLWLGELDRRARAREMQDAQNPWR